MITPPAKNSHENEIRFAAVISHPIQHYAPVFRELATVSCIRVRVFYAYDHAVKESFDPGFGVSFSWDVPLLDGYEYEFLHRGVSPKNFSFLEVDSPKLTERLDAFSPDVLWIHGYGQRLSWRALLWAHKKAMKIYFGDSELLHHRNIFRRLIKQLILPRFFKRCDAIITVGDNNEAYYKAYGVPENKMYRGACPIEIARYKHVLNTTRPEDIAAWRSIHGIAPDSFVVGWCGKFQDYKRPEDLIAAIEILGHRGLDVHALLIGDGPLKTQSLQQARSLGIADRVHITGFINQTEVPRAMIATDVLTVTSSRDAHPLVVAEALALGLPVIASDRVGCVGPTDTVRPDKNALVYRCGNVPELADSISKLVTDQGIRKSMAESSLAIAPTQDTSVTVRSVLKAIVDRQARFEAVGRNVQSRVWDQLSRAATLGC